MKPFRIFIFFGAVLLLLSTIACFMPEGGISINEDVRFTFLSLSDVFNKQPEPNGENVERLLASSTVSEDPEADPVTVSGENQGISQTRTASSYGVLGHLEDSGRYSRRTAANNSGNHAGNNSEDHLKDYSGDLEENTNDPPREETWLAESGPVDRAEPRSDPDVQSAFEPDVQGAFEPDVGSGYEPDVGSGSEPDVEAGRNPAPTIRAANADSLQKSVFPLSFASNGASMLEPFFRTLDDLKKGNIIRARILHFGDSQIENDRMTALIRYRLQKNYGGTGSGLVQAIPLYSGSMAYQEEQEGTWLRYTYFRNRDTTILHNSYGVMAAFASVPTPTEEGWPMLHYSFNLSRRSGRCDRVKVFLHSYVEGATLVFNVNDTISDTIRNIPGGYSMADYRHLGIVKDLKLYLNFPEGGRIYGISFESFTGLQVDNIAMRGSSGLIFSRMDREQQETMMGELSPSLILLQFGGNVVPYMNPRYYRRAFEKELEFFKEICPGVPVIVIGPADMSIREKGVFKSYPGIEKIRDALKYATLESGFAFWDLYEAMGGDNSMPSFVHADPPLASADYVHFNGLGINLVAEMFYNALMMEYEHYSQSSLP
jgi:lysophospholipase L1-like esterase